MKKIYMIKTLLTLAFIFFVTSLNVQSTETTIPNVSVIIPVYNTSKYLKTALDSVLEQSLKNIEIICVNDGSTDISMEIINEYAKKDSRIKIIDQENKGAAAARNAGMKIASGEFIAFIDSDDTIEKNAYEKSYEIAKKYNAEILMFNENITPMLNDFCINGFNALNIPGSMMLWNKLYKRSFLEFNNFKIPEHLSCYHDECFNSVVLPKAERVACLKAKFYHYKRKRTGSIQNSLTLEKRAENILKYTRYVYDNWKNNNYIKDHGFWLLKKISFMSNRVLEKKDYNISKHFSNSLMSIIGNEVYNPDNIKKLRNIDKILLNSWVQYTN